MSDEEKRDISKEFGESYNGSSLGGDLGLKGVRNSPSQYLGSRSIEGAIQAWLEIIQNSVDESAELLAFLRKHDVDTSQIPEFKIDIEIFKDDSIVISDTGRGVPADISDKFQRPVVEAAFEEINVGGKGRGYVEEGQSAYLGKTIGTHGSGAACANATSDYFYVDTYVMKDKKHYRVEWEKAVKTKVTTLIGDSGGRNGTVISFRPSKEVFEMYSDKQDGPSDRFYKEKDLLDILEEYAYNTENNAFTFRFQNDDATWNETVLRSSEHTRVERLKPYVKGEVYNAIMEDSDVGYSMEISIGLASNRQNFLTCNMLRLKHGTHLAVIGESLNELLPEIIVEINKKLKEKKMNKEFTERELNDLRIGSPINFVSMYLSLFMDEPDYTGQSKEELRVPRIKTPMKNKFKELLETSLTGIKEELINEITRISLIHIERQDVYEKEKERKKARADRKAKEKELLRSNDPSYVKGMGEEDRHLTRARNQNLKEVILYMVEGESAKAQLVSARDVNSEAIYSVIQRPPNVFIHNDEKLWGMQKFKELYKVLYGNKNGDYKAIVIATDPDADGGLIKSLLISFIYKFFPHYLTQGRVFLFNAPKVSARKDEETLYFFSNYERRKHQEKHGVEGWKYFTYKGLGSIPTPVLREILDGTKALQQIDKTSIVDGMKDLQRFLTDKKYKKMYVMKNYGSQELFMYEQARKEIIKHQEVEYDVNELDTQYTYEPDLTNVKMVTIIEEIVTNNRITENEIELDEEEIDLMDAVLDDDFDME